MTITRPLAARIELCSRGRRFVVAVIAAAVIPLLACSGGDAPGAVQPPAVPTGMSAGARVYLDSALNLMQSHSINRKVINWPPLRARAVSAAGTAQTTAATYPAIRAAILELGDRHSGFYEPGTFRVADEGPPVAQGSAAGAAAPLRLPEGERIHPRIAWLTVPQYSNRDGDPVVLTDAYHTLLRSLDGPEICGWIVDARGNLGGNMYPMVAGAGALAGNGIGGFFVDPDSNITAWYHHDGTSGVTTRGGPVPGSRVVGTSRVPFVVRSPPLPVAVLHDSLTASSGEALVITFRGLPNARSFGAATWGVSTANRGFALSDGALLNLTVAYMADRQGRIYGSRVVPDQPVSPAAARDSATAWLLRQTACTG